MEEPKIEKFGEDYNDTTITIGNLLSNTSGLTNLDVKCCASDPIIYHKRL